MTIVPNEGLKDVLDPDPRRRARRDKTTSVQNEGLKDDFRVRESPRKPVTMTIVPNEGLKGRLAVRPAAVQEVTMTIVPNEGLKALGGRLHLRALDGRHNDHRPE